MNSRYGRYFAVLLWFCDTVVGIPRRRKIECMASTNLLKQRETRIHVVNAGAQSIPKRPSDLFPAPLYSCSMAVRIAAAELLAYN